MDEDVSDDDGVTSGPVAWIPFDPDSTTVLTQAERQCVGRAPTDPTHMLRSMDVAD